MLKFKQYLDEQELLNEGSTSASTLFEGVLVDCWNMSVKYNVSSKWSNNKDQKKFTKEILNLPDTFAFLKASKSKKEWATTGKTPEEQGELFWGLSKLCKQKIKGVSGDAKGAGSTKKTLSGKWKEITGKTVDTSKADIIIGDTGISVKAPAANIMSGKQLEGKATVIAAMEKSKGSEVTKNILLGYLDKFVTEANTVGAEWSGRKLKNADPKELEGINSEIQKDLLKAEGVFKSLSENAFKNAFSNPAVGNAFAYEAMTGEEKFAGRVFGDVGDETGEATHMLIWDYDLKKLKFYKAKEKVRDVAKGLKMEATLKSSRREKKREGKKVKVGYSIYQSMRLAINTSLEDADKLTDDVKEEIQKMENMLSEGIINEFSFKEKLGKLWSSVKDKLKGIWNWLKEQLNKIKEIFNEMWDEGLDSVLSYFETDVKIKVNQTIRL